MEREILLILHFLGLAMALGSGIVMFTIMTMNRDLPAEEKKSLMQKIRGIEYVGPAGLLILIVSGVKLMMPLWPALKKEGMFHTKLTLVFVLFVLVGLGHMKRAKARRKGEVATPPKWVVPLPMILGITIVILAVLTFNG